MENSDYMEFKKKSTDYQPSELAASLSLNEGLGVACNMLNKGICP